MKETKKSALSGAKVTTGVRVGKVNGYKNSVLHAKRDARRIKAEALQREHNQLTIAEKIALAKSRRGKSKKEITRLEKLLANIGKPLPKPVVAAKPVEITPASVLGPVITEKKKIVKKPKIAKVE